MFFIGVLVQPVFATLAKLDCVDLKDQIENLASNQEHWKTIIQDFDRPLKEGSEDAGASGVPSPSYEEGPAPSTNEGNGSGDDDTAVGPSSPSEEEAAPEIIPAMSKTRGDGDAPATTE